MENITMIIEDLRKCATTINETVTMLMEQYKKEETAKVVNAPHEDPPPSLEAVRAVLADKSRAGFTTQIRALLQKYGSDKLSGIDPVNYKALLAAVEEFKNVN